MTRDWRKVALAVLAAAALAAVCALVRVLRPSRRAKAAKAPAKAAAGKQRTTTPTTATKSQPRLRPKKKKQDPAEAQRAIDAAAKLLQARQGGQAVQPLDAPFWLAAICRPRSWRGRCYMRGIAYRQQSKPAQAISDLTSALWLKGGLTAEDRPAMR